MNTQKINEMTLGEVSPNTRGCCRSGLGAPASITQREEEGRWKISERQQAVCLITTSNVSREGPGSPWGGRGEGLPVEETGKAGER